MIAKQRHKCPNIAETTQSSLTNGNISVTFINPLEFNTLKKDENRTNYPKD
jgi:hypothetical protein